MPLKSAATAMRLVERPLVPDAPERAAPGTVTPTPPAAAILDAVMSRTDAPSREISLSSIRLEVYGDLGEIEKDWRAFEQIAERTAFQSFAWLAAWQRHIGARRDVRPAIVAGRDGSGRLVFLLPLMIERRWTVRRLSWLGADLCDYNAPLLAPHFARSLRPDTFIRLWRDVLRLLAADRRFRFDLIDLAKMPDRIDGHRNPFLALPVTANPSNAYVATLGDDWEAFYSARRSSSTRKTERKQLKRLADHGDVRFAEPGAAEARADTLATLVAQKRQTLARMGAEDMFARPGRLDFYRDVATDPALAEFVHIARLDVGDETGAASVALRHAGRYALILSSYQGDALAPYGPGRAHLHELLRHTIEHGFRWFDFTIGDEPYKRDWCDVEVKLFDHTAVGSARGWPVAKATELYRRAKRTVKQSPAAWRAFTRLRAFAASALGRHAPPNQDS